MIIKKGGCRLETTMEKYVRHYKQSGYIIVEEDKHDLDKMTYQELQALYSDKLGKTGVGVPKKEILEALKEVV